MYLAWPVAINGKTQTQDGKQLHLTLKWFPKGEPPDLKTLSVLLKSCDLSPPSFRDQPKWELEEWSTAHVLAWKNPPNRIKEIRKILDQAFGDSSGFDFQPHVTLPWHWWNHLQQMGPGHCWLEFGQFSLWDLHK